MGQAGSSSREPPSPSPGIVKLNDSLYELYTPEKGQPKLEIVFFHGFQMTEHRDGYWRSWTTTNERGEEELWPREWLADKFPQSRILSVSFDSSAFMSPTSGRQDLFAIGEALLTDVVHFGSVGQDKPLVLVGHSLGGLVIKQVILEANRQCSSRLDDGSTQRSFRNFVNNIKGLFYFSTPHRDSQLTDLANFIPSGWTGLSEVMKKIAGVESLRLNEAFRIWRKQRSNQIKAFSVGETSETPSRQKSFRRQSSILVPETSSQYDTDFYLAGRGENHFQVVTPKGREDPKFEALTDFISVVTMVPLITFELDSFKMVTGVAVERPEGFRTRRSFPAPRGPDTVTGTPVKASQVTEGKDPYVKIGVPENLESFQDRYPDMWRSDARSNSDDGVV